MRTSILALVLGGCTVTTSTAPRPAYVEYVYTCREPRAVVTTRTPPVAPPADAAEDPGDPPPNTTWVPGHWDYHGRDDGFVWMPGRHERRRPGIVWVPPRTEDRPNGRHRFTPGHWRPTRPDRPEPSDAPGTVADGNRPTTDEPGATPEPVEPGQAPGTVGEGNRPPRRPPGLAPGGPREPNRPTHRPRPDVNPGAVDPGRTGVPTEDRLASRLRCTGSTPERQIRGGIVRLQGRGFGDDAEHVDVRLEGIPAAQIRRVSDHEIVAKVPAEGRSGHWTVQVDGVGEVTCEGTFAVGDPHAPPG